MEFCQLGFFVFFYDFGLAFNYLIIKKKKKRAFVSVRDFADGKEKERGKEIWGGDEREKKRETY